MFLPHVSNSPFRFQCVATDLDGRRIHFDLPMIFMENMRVAPNDENGPDYEEAVEYAEDAMKAFKKNNYNTVNLNWQRVALAPSMKSGDTSVQVSQLIFSGFTEDGNESLEKYSEKLTLPMWVPQVEEIKARIGPIAHLSGSQNAHTLEFNKKYLRMGIKPEDGNKGQVFIDIKPSFDGPNLDFSSQGDKSGGFIQPNLKPAALSRMAGPVMGDVDKFIMGEMPKGAGFPTPEFPTPNLPIPLLFGCIPLGELIQEANIANYPERVPKFISEVGTKVESFFNDMDRLYNFMADIPEQSVSIAEAALSVFIDTLDDLNDQAKACTSDQRGAVESNVNNAKERIDNLINALVIDPISPIFPNWSNFGNRIGSINTAVGSLKPYVENLKQAANATYNDGVFLPAGLRQSILNTVQKLNVLLDQLDRLQDLMNTGKNLWDALNAIIGDPQKLENLLANDNELKNRLEALNDTIDPFRTELNKTELLDGAPRNTVLTALKAVEDIIKMKGIVDMLTGDELTTRFDWNPEIKDYPTDNPLFRAKDKKGLLVAVEAKVKKNGSSSPKISVNCSLKHFDLVLIGPVKSFIELNFEKIEFSVDSASKMNVDVKFTDIKFVGVLSFVETLRDVIPLNGFSDPPYLDITSKGIDAGYDISLPSIACGILNIANVSLGAGFTVPFIGQPMSVRFNFCTREKPFLLTVYAFGGGGFFGITLDPKGVQILEAALEFGAAVSVNLGVASGGVHVMAGIYYRMEQSKASLTGYFRMGGNLRVLGLINASIEFYLGLTYEFSSGKCVGTASLTIKVSVAFFSTKVTVTCERKFAGSNGDPTLRQMLGYRPDLELDDEIGEIEAQGNDVEYAWRDYLEAFA